MLDSNSMEPLRKSNVISARKSTLDEFRTLTPTIVVTRPFSMCCNSRVLGSPSGDYMPKLLFAVALLTCSASLYAQTAPLVCDGRRGTVRISALTPGGSAKGYMDAV